MYVLEGDRCRISEEQLSHLLPDFTYFSENQMKNKKLDSPNVDGGRKTGKSTIINNYTRQITREPCFEQNEAPKPSPKMLYWRAPGKMERF